MECPICKSEMEHWNDYMDYTLMESENKCTQCEQYIEHFSTGGYEVGIKVDERWFTWQWYYDTPANEYKEIEQQMEAAAMEAMIHLKRDTMDHIYREEFE